MKEHNSTLSQHLTADASESPQLWGWRLHPPHRHYHSFSWACMDLSLLSSPSLSSYSTRQKSWIFQKELSGGFTKHLHMLEVPDFWKQPNTFHNTGYKTVHFSICAVKQWNKNKVVKPPLSKDWMSPHTIHNSPSIFPISFSSHTDSKRALPPEHG